MISAIWICQHVFLGGFFLPLFHGVMVELSITVSVILWCITRNIQLIFISVADTEFLRPLKFPEWRKQWRCFGGWNEVWVNKTLLHPAGETPALPTSLCSKPLTAPSHSHSQMITLHILLFHWIVLSNLTGPAPSCHPPYASSLDLPSHALDLAVGPRILGWLFLLTGFQVSSVTQGSVFSFSSWILTFSLSTGFPPSAHYQAILFWGWGCF